MEVNFSSTSLHSVYHCSDSVGGVISTAFVIIHVSLLLPLSLLVLYLAQQRWRRQHRSFATTSHSDIFTYHSALIELIFALGSAFSICGRSFGLLELATVGFYASSNFFSGQVSFHVLTCVERYLAVVHPVIYLGLRQSGGVRIRNISIGCVWLLYWGWMGITAFYFPDVADTPFFCLLVFSLVVVSFCNLSVLCVLIRPGPGEVGGNRKRVDHSKQRAFNTITAITGALWLFFIGLLVSLALDKSHLLSLTDGCLVLTSGYWSTLPCSLVLPLLFLHRAGKLLCCHGTNE